MPPRSARKRKSVDGEANAAPSRRRKREVVVSDKEEEALECSGSSCSPVIKTMELSAVDEGDEGMEKGAMSGSSLVSALDEPQLMESADGTTSAGLDESLAAMLDTQNDGDPQDDEMLFTLGEEEEVDGHEEEEAEEKEEAYAEEEVVTEALAMNEGAVDAQEDEDGGDGDVEAKEGDAGRDSLNGASASIEEILQQLAEVATNFMVTYRDLAAEGDAIQAELNQLDYEQEGRCESMLARLQRAGNSIFSFGQPPDDDGGGSQIDASAAQEMSVL